MMTQNWVIDYRGPNRAQMYRVKDTVMFTKSAYQEILIADTYEFGRSLFLDGIPQSCELDEHVYHEALVHPAMIQIQNPKTIFVAGGGEGSILREILRHDTVEDVIMCDIDDMMVDAAKKHLKSWHEGAFENNKVKLFCEDARGYLENSQKKFDCIIVDMPDPLSNSPAALLFTNEFFEIAKSQLNPGGVVSVQSEAADMTDYLSHISVVKTLRKSFRSVASFQVWLSFYGLSWGFVMASDNDFDLRPEFIAQKLNERNCSNLKYYDPETHNHMFSLPKFLRDAILDEKAGKIITDKDVLVVE